MTNRDRIKTRWKFSIFTFWLTPDPSLWGKQEMNIADVKKKINKNALLSGAGKLIHLESNCTYLIGTVEKIIKQTFLSKFLSHFDSIS